MLTATARAASFQDDMRQGGSALRSGDYSGAVRWFNAALALQPGNRNAQYWDSYAGGLQAARAGNWDNAASYWKRCIALYPITANNLNPKIAYATRASANKNTANFREFAGDATIALKLLAAIIELP